MIGTVNSVERGEYTVSIVSTADFKTQELVREAADMSHGTINIMSHDWEPQYLVLCIHPDWTSQPSDSTYVYIDFVNKTFCHIEDATTIEWYDFDDYVTVSFIEEPTAQQPWSGYVTYINLIDVGATNNKVVGQMYFIDR